jgi:hypothetical protein
VTSLGIQGKLYGVDVSESELFGIRMKRSGRWWDWRGVFRMSLDHNPPYRLSEVDSRKEETDHCKRGGLSSGGGIRESDNEGTSLTRA